MTHTTRKGIFAVILILATSGCTTIGERSEAQDVGEAPIVFDKAKWREKQGVDYPYRNVMLNDLMTNHNLKSLRKDSLINLLGSPDRTDKNYLFYMVDQERLYSWPLHTKTLVIKLREDSSVEWVKIHK